MRLNSKAMLAIGCVSLVALSIPALSRPSPRGLDPERPALQGNHQQVRPAQPLRPGAVRQRRNGALVATPVTAPPARPGFGWPALVTEARKYVGTNPTDRNRLWCARFLNLVLAKTGYAGTGSDAAKSFAHYGQRVPGPKVGAIAVLTRGKRGGHVGIVTGLDARGNPIIISGNHGRRVGEAVYPRRRVIAYVMPTEASRRAPTQLAQLSPLGSERPNAEPLDATLRTFFGLDAQAQARPQQLVPHRTAPQGPQLMRGELPLDPKLAELFGISERGRPVAAPPQRTLQHAPGRVAANSGLAGFLGLPQPR